MLFFMPFSSPEMFFLPYPSGKFMLMLFKLCPNVPPSGQESPPSVMAPVRPDHGDAFSCKVLKPQTSRLKRWGALGLTDLQARGQGLWGRFSTCCPR